MLQSSCVLPFNEFYDREEIYALNFSSITPESFMIIIDILAFFAFLRILIYKLRLKCDGSKKKN